MGASSGAVTVTAVSKDDASVTITATKSGKPELSAVFTIVKVKSGRDGEDGANGTSVTVKSTSVTYAVSTSGTTAPASGWSATIPSVPVGQYLWSKTVVTYSDGKSTTTHSVLLLREERRERHERDRYGTVHKIRSEHDREPACR